MITSDKATNESTNYRTTEEIRKDFPILTRKVHGKPLVYLDSTASSQKPRAVIDAMNVYYETYHANVHRGVYEISEQATAAMEKARVKVAHFINARHSRQIIFTRNTTESINLVAISWGGANIAKGDLIVLTEMEHHSNLVPWQLLAQRTGATFRWLPIDDDGRIVEASIDDVIGPRTRIVAFVHQSNALGTINPVQRIAARAREVGAL